MSLFKKGEIVYVLGEYSMCNWCPLGEYGVVLDFDEDQNLYEVGVNYPWNHRVITEANWLKSSQDMLEQYQTISAEHFRTQDFYPKPPIPSDFLYDKDGNPRSVIDILVKLGELLEGSELCDRFKRR